MPVIENPGHRVRVMTGKSNGAVGATPLAMPFTSLDITLRANGRFIHCTDAGDAAWLHVIQGEVEVELDGLRQQLGNGVALATHGANEIRPLSSKGGQIVLLSGAALREPFAQKGPFAMRDIEQLAAVISAYEAGELGSLD
jgi:redox-sensitive bicupin YhaK (pirin superfamily)